ncbi:MAG: hypothetical protein OEY09_10680 [Gammaproteobacteria bacterium]|nr:hypothetical protein [Gammaproteobacteria bacterium]
MLNTSVTTSTDVDQIDVPDITDISLITDISKAMRHLSDESSADLAKQEMMKDLVDDYLNSSNKERPVRKSIIRKLFKLE